MPLVWFLRPDGAWTATYALTPSRSRVGPRSFRGPAREHVLFALVRPARNCNGLVDIPGGQTMGWVIGSRGFEPAQWCATFPEAKNIVEAMYALEQD